MTDIQKAKEEYYDIQDVTSPNFLYDRILIAENYIKALESLNAEMLTALIKAYKASDKIAHPPGDTCPLCIMESAIEKATGKPIDEVLKNDV